MKYFIISPFIVFLFIQPLSCNQPNTSQLRYKTMSLALDAFSKKDSAQLYQVVDTSSWYAVKGKQAFRNIYEKLNRYLNTKKISMDTVTFHQVECRPENNDCYLAGLEIADSEYKSVTVIFHFNPAVSRQVDFFEVFLIPKNAIEPTIDRAPR